MESFDTQSVNALDDDEISRLVSIVVEELGPALARTQFNDVMLGLFEHIAGLETIPTTTARQYLNTLWLKYQHASKKTTLTDDLGRMVIPTWNVVRPSPHPQIGKLMT